MNIIHYIRRVDVYCRQGLVSSVAGPSEAFVYVTQIWQMWQIKFENENSRRYWTRNEDLHNQRHLREK